MSKTDKRIDLHMYVYAQFVKKVHEKKLFVECSFPM